jgi:hypothetical protein
MRALQLWLPRLCLLPLGLLMVSVQAQQPSLRPRRPPIAYPTSSAPILPTNALPKPTGKPRSVFELVLRPEWPSYMQALHHFQKLYPGSFTPPELIRFDKLPLPELSEQVARYTPRWTRLRGANPGSTPGELAEAQLTVSREANQALLGLLQARRSSDPSAALPGSTRLIIDRIPEEQRMGLTPIDEVFKTTELGKQIFSQIEARFGPFHPSAFVVDEKGRRIFLETDPGRGPTAPDGGSGTIQLQFLPSADGKQTQIKTLFGNEAIGTDVRYRNSEFKGNLLNPKDTLSRLPLGPFPASSQRWMNEGTTHFSGDGHNH